MKLSVIIACFNAADTLGTQLEALVQQQWSEPWEVIVADNGSQDNSVAIAEQYMGRIPNLQIVDASDRQGAAHARNVGAALAQGEALAFCDADDELASGWVAAMGEALADHRFVVGRIQHQKLNPASLAKKQKPWKNGLINSNLPPYLPHGATCNLGVHRALHISMGGFDEALLRYEDIDYCWRLQLMGIHPYYAEKAIVEYRLRKTSGSIYKRSKLSGRSSVLMYKKYRHLIDDQMLWLDGVKGWLRLFKQIYKLTKKKERVHWFKDFGWRIGRFYGSVKYRVLLP